MLEARGVESSGHTRRVAEMAIQLGEAAGLSPAELVHLRRGALLHDIGMLSIPESVLVKAGPLTETERAIVQQHPDYGFGILAPLSICARRWISPTAIMSAGTAAATHAGCAAT